MNRFSKVLIFVLLVSPLASVAMENNENNNFVFLIKLGCLGAFASLTNTSPVKRISPYLGFTPKELDLVVKLCSGLGALSTIGNSDQCHFWSKMAPFAAIVYKIATSLPVLTIVSNIPLLGNLVISQETIKEKRAKYGRYKKAWRNMYQILKDNKVDYDKIQAKKCEKPDDQEDTVKLAHYKYEIDRYDIDKRDELSKFLLGLTIYASTSAGYKKFSDNFEDGTREKFGNLVAKAGRA